ncbi:CWF19-like protein 1 [Mytilus edulis]|uniref:CWF19-like protein 1 n=1 Tax=Mytilus edulis TaxID=6550 RepID=A0A8S3RAG6_MYTED|nr:CWF19-like protein 1 [Mytilus edulis]
MLNLAASVSSILRSFNVSAPSESWSRNVNTTENLLLCVGDFFGTNFMAWESYVKGEKKVPIATLILGPNKFEHTDYYKDNKDGGDLCDNVTYLGIYNVIGRNTDTGKKGTYNGSSGLTIAYLSGTESSEGKSGEINFSQQDVTSLLLPVATDTKFQGVDILITSQWPKGVDRYGIPVGELATTNVGSSLVSQLAINLRPRYHFCGMENVFYERQPYRNHKVLAEKERHVTRFIGLAKLSNTQKKKYLYAFSITPLSSIDQSELTKQTPDVTECPFNMEESKPRQEKESDAQFFYDMTPREEKGKKRQRDKDGGPDRKQIKHKEPTGPCWFCLGSPEVEKHLVVSVGIHTYLALAKGGLVDDHILILPIGHHQSTTSAPSEVIDEINRYKTALKKFFKQIGKSVVFFERNYKTQHLQIQVVPVPIDCVQELKDAFMQCSEEENVELNEIPKHSDLKQIVPSGTPYFYAEIPSGEKLLHRIKKQFPIQFGRDVLSSVQVLNMPERVDWRNCKISKDKEARLAAKFKEDFKQFDLNLD